MTSRWPCVITSYSIHYTKLYDIPVILLTARKRGWFDEVNERKIHTGKIPRLGGVGIFWSFFVTLALVALFSKGSAKDLLAYWPVGAAMLIVHVVGLVDDFRSLKARLKFLVHVAAAVIVAAAGYRFRTIFVPWVGAVELGWLSYVITSYSIHYTKLYEGFAGLDGLEAWTPLVSAAAQLRNNFV